jgi:predicted sugar kinase
VVKTRRFMPFAPAKSRNEAEANSAFHQTFLKAMPPDPETAGQTGVPVNVEQSRIIRLDLLQMHLALMNCNSAFLQQESNDTEQKAKANKLKIDELNAEIHAVMEEVKEAVKAMKLAGANSSSSSSRPGVFGSAEDETDNATLSMVDSDSDEDEY